MAKKQGGTQSIVTSASSNLPPGGVENPWHDQFTPIQSAGTTTSLDKRLNWTERAGNK